MFKTALKERVLLFDGAMGTEIQKMGLQDDCFPEGQNGFNDGLTLTRPDIIEQIHEMYLDAGADCIQTNTFGSNKPKLDEYSHGADTVKMNEAAAKIARQAADKYGDRYVIGTIGPTGFLPSGPDKSMDCTLDEISDAFDGQIRGLLGGGADALVIETSNDVLELKTIITTIRSQDADVPIIANVTLPMNSKMLLGTPIEAAYTTISGMQINAFGINCSTGPDDMMPAIDWLQENSDHDLLIVPNAGLPDNKDGEAVYSMTPDIMGKAMKHIVKKHDKVRMIGGCCGTTPDHIRSMRAIIDAAC